MPILFDVLEHVVHEHRLSHNVGLRFAALWQLVLESQLPNGTNRLVARDGRLVFGNQPQDDARRLVVGPNENSAGKLHQLWPTLLEQCGQQESLKTGDVGRYGGREHVGEVLGA